MKEKQQPETLTYSEAVKVNIGDYESRDFFVCYGSVKVDIKDGETFDQAYKRARNKVRKKINSEEKKARIQSRQFVDFDTKAKLR